MEKFEEFYADLLSIGYEQKLEGNEAIKRRAFNRYLQNFAERLEEKVFDFKEDVKFLTIFSIITIRNGENQIYICIRNLIENI